MKILALLSLLALAACGQGNNRAMARQEDAPERFYSGGAHPGEFLRPADLTAIPASFDEDVQ